MERKVCRLFGNIQKEDNFMKMKTVRCIIAAALAIGMVGAIPTAAPILTGITASAADVQTVQGKYTVNIQLKQFGSDSLSMGNASMKNPAMLIVNADGTSRIEIDMQSLKYLGRDGYLGWLKKVTKVISENKYHYPTEIETEDAAVLEEYTGVYDVFNDPESTSADKVMSGRWYPKKLSIPVENGEDDILVQVYVPVMESIMSGGGTKFARLVIDYSTLERVVEPLEMSAEVSDTSIVLGNTIKVSALAQGGTGDYTYAFYYKKTTDKSWTAKQGFKSNSTVSIKPAKAVKYRICVKAKDSAGTIVKKYFNVTVNPALKNTSAISSDTVKYGEKINIQASAEGGTGGYTYAVLYKKTTDTKWVVKQNFASNANISVKPAKAADYQVCVKVKDTSGKIAKTYYDVKVIK